MASDWSEIWDLDRVASGIECPECGGQVQYRVLLYETSNGKPVEVDFDCLSDPWHDHDEDDPDDEEMAEMESEHQYRQCDWQPIRDKLERLARDEWRLIRKAESEAPK